MLMKFRLLLILTKGSLNKAKTQRFYLNIYHIYGIFVI